MLYCRYHRVGCCGRKRGLVSLVVTLHSLKSCVHFLPDPGAKVEQFLARDVSLSTVYNILGAYDQILITCCLLEDEDVTLYSVVVFSVKNYFMSQLYYISQCRNR